MKICAINTTNFKGLFTDKSKENEGNWRMEYQPYSWEKNEYGHYGIAPQSDIDIYASCLPDNEKNYMDTVKYDYMGAKGRKSCKDILGTEFYYHEVTTDVARKTIIPMPAMSREDSLRVYNSKLAKFIEAKESKLSKIVSAELQNAENAGTNIETYSNEYNKHSANVKKGFFDAKICDKETSYKVMDSQFNNLKTTTNEILNTLKDTLRLNSTINTVNALIQRNQAEISLLETLRKSNRLIDISRRDVYDPNKPLWDALQNLPEAMEKYVVLPNNTLSIKEILNSLGEKIKKTEIPHEVIKYVDKIM